MSDSILDKVLSRKEDQEKQEFNPLEVINALLKTLSSKEADVLRRRFGLTENGKETLETIGAHYNVTRERIRQIENQSIQKIKQSSVFSDTIKPVEHLVITLLNNHGGVMTREMVYETLLGVNKDSRQNQQAVSFILSKLLDDKIEEIAKVKKYEPGWKLKLASMDFVDTVIEELEKVIRATDEPQQFEVLYESFQETELYKQNDQKLTEDTVLSYLNVSAKLAKNPFGEYGLASWGSIMPKRMNDRVYLVLQKEGKPMHFEDIAKRITKVFKKRAYPPTVHNELILNKEYVLVGRGIYALREWGYKEGVVADILTDILNKAGKPMKRSELVNKVLEQRIVKKNTILLALSDKTRFKKTKEGTYTAIETSTTNQSAPEEEQPIPVEQDTSHTDEEQTEE